jgi:hypothetical protein
LREKQENPSMPTIAPLNAKAADWRENLVRFAAATDLAEENAARDGLLAEARTDLAFLHARVW